VIRVRLFGFQTIRVWLGSTPHAAAEQTVAVTENESVYVRRGHCRPFEPLGRMREVRAAVVEEPLLGMRSVVVRVVAERGVARIEIPIPSGGFRVEETAGTLALSGARRVGAMEVYGEVVIADEELAAVVSSCLALAL